VAALHPVL